MMISTLRHVLSARRIEAGVSFSKLEAAGPGLDRSGYARFEAGESLPRNLDGVIDAYAVVLGTEPTLLWADALAAWVDDPNGLLSSTALRGRQALAALEQR